MKILLKIVLLLVFPYSCSAQNNPENYYNEGNRHSEVGKWGFINKTGKKIIDCKYGWANKFTEGLAAVEKNGKWGFIDKSGKEIIACQYELYFYDDIEQHNFSDGLAVIEKNKKWGFIDKSGKEMIPCQYDYVFRTFSDGLAVVMRNSEF